MADLRNLPPDVADALAQGNVIEAIKRLREQHKTLSLAEARALLEAVKEQGGAKVEVKTTVRRMARPAPHAGVERRPGLSPGEMPRGGSRAAIAAIVLLAVVVFAAAAYFNFF
jgi:hypothetical protein